MSIEEEFKAVLEAHRGEIDVQLEKASKSLRKACAIADKYGIPFYSNISFISQCYQPESFDVIRQGLESEDVDIYDILEDGWGECDGWQHSAVCY